MWNEKAAQKQCACAESTKRTVDSIFAVFQWNSFTEGKCRENEAKVEEAVPQQYKNMVQGREVDELVS